MIIAFTLVVLFAFVFSEHGHHGDYAGYPKHEPAGVEAPVTNEKRIADYTAALAWFTGVLALATVALCGGTLLLWLETRHIRHETKAEASRQDDRFFKQYEMSLRATKAAHDSAQAAKFSADLASTTFIAVHRPRMRVRNIVMKTPTTSLGPQPWNAQDAINTSVNGQFYIANIGTNNADKLGWHYQFFVGC